MRESRKSGSEGGAAQTNALSLPLSFAGVLLRAKARVRAPSSSTTLPGGRPGTTEP
jgi:hypothetical protein